MKGQPRMHDPADIRTARIADGQHILHLVSRFPALRSWTVTEGLASFNYTDIPDAEAAAGSVRTAEGILSRQLGVTFEGRYPAPVGSAAHYQRTARLPSGLWVFITAQAAVGPLIDREDETSDAGELVAAA